jgi:hypothetical protein
MNYIYLNKNFWRNLFFKFKLNSNYFKITQDPDPDPKLSEKSDPDPGSDPKKIIPDPQHCFL